MQFHTCTFLSVCLDVNTNIIVNFELLLLDLPIVGKELYKQHDLINSMHDCSCGSSSALFQNLYLHTYWLVLSFSILAVGLSAVHKRILGARIQTFTCRK